MQLYRFENTSNAFNFVFEKKIPPNETIIVKLPVVSANKRGVNDIGWASDGDVTLYGTLSQNPNKDDAIWQEILENNEINKVTSAIKIVNNENREVKIEMRAIFN